MIDFFIDFFENLFNIFFAFIIGLLFLSPLIIVLVLQYFYKFNDILFSFLLLFSSIISCTLVFTSLRRIGL